MKKIGLSCLFLGIITTVHAQSYSSSPNATAFAQQTLAPVNMYNGTPNISIPIFNVKDEGTYLPISLSYQGSAIRVEQEASWVGLGWNLNVGGVITKVIVGEEDLPGDYLNTSGGSIYSLTSFWESGSTCYDYYFPKAFNAMYDAYKDELLNDLYKPDIYYFNFYGYSGQFVMDHRDPANIKPYIISNSTDILFQPIGANYGLNSGWTATTSDGTVFTFGSSDSERELVYDYNDPVKTSISFYLSKIQFPNGGEIFFYYSSGTSHTNICSLSQVLNYIGTGSEVPENYFSQLEFTPKYPSQIVTPNYSVSFSMGDREDIPGEKKLQSITLNYVQTGQSQTIYFSTSYFTSSSIGGSYLNLLGSCNGITSDMDNKRLKLNSITLPGNVNYEFTYNSTLLPKKTSYARDFWGFYNGAANTTLVPNPGSFAPYDDKYKFLPVGFITHSGANRAADETFAKACILEKVKYPGGGVIEYEWESHKFSNYKVAPFVDLAPEIYISKATTTNNTGPILDFTLPDNRAGTSFNIYLEAGTNPANAEGNYVILQYKYPNDASFTDLKKWTSGSTGDVDETYNPTTLLTDQIYRLVSYVNTSSISTNEYAEIKATISYRNFISSGGGLRIKKITTRTSDGGSIASAKEFHYATEERGISGSSSGNLLSKLRYLQVIPAAGGTYYQIVSNSNTSLAANAQGSFVGYNKVTVESKGGEDIGYSEYNYTNSDIDYYSTLDYTPIFNLPTYPVTNNGQLISEKHFNAEGIIKSKKTLSYQPKVNTGFYFGAGAYYDPDNVLWMDFYWTPQSLYVLNNINEKIYDDNGDSITNEKFFEYNSIGQLIRSTEYSSENNVQLINEITNAYDYTGANSTILAMKANHCYTPVIQQVTKKKKIDNTIELIAGRKTDFISKTYSGKQVFLPQYNWHSFDGTNYTKDVTLTYDSEGKLLQRDGKDGVTVAYIWGYNKSKIVAEVTGATHAQAIALLVPDIQSLTGATLRTELNKIRTGIPSAYVTTYTYDSMFGVTSATDANGVTISNVYDSQGRLFRVLDEDGNVIKETHYNTVN